mmetsp:Transcript_17185/g.34318  ORF Transcript_17185/g.34318 Transcript_17185/m.34318 type:complete len:202 (+) Transcript_17185:815-1420(+)
MLHLRGEAHVATASPLVLVLCCPHEIGVLSLARAHHDELAVSQHALVITTHHPSVALSDDVDTLLGGQAPDERDQRRLGVLVEPECLLQLLLAHSLAREVGGSVGRREEGILGRVPLVRVDAVEDAVQPVLPVPDVVLEFPTAGVRHDFVLVRRGDRYQAVSHVDATEEQLDTLPVVHHPSVPSVLLREDPLVHVVVGIIS